MKNAISHEKSRFTRLQDRFSHKKSHFTRLREARALPLRQGDVAELHFFPLTLQADVSRFHFVRAGILVDAIDINGDDAVFHENIRLVPFAGRLFAAVGMLLHDREGRTGNAGFRLVFCQVP